MSKKKDDQQGEGAEKPVFVHESPAETLKAPKHARTVTVGGEQYDVEEDGTVTVPAEFAAELVESHGYARID